MSIHHIAILVHDLAAAEAFYTGVVGLGVERRWKTDDDDIDRSVWLISGDTRIMLVRADPEATARGSRGPGWHVVAFRIETSDRDAVRARLKENGCYVRESEHTLYATDPEGNQVAFSCAVPA